MRHVKKSAVAMLVLIAAGVLTACGSGDGGTETEEIVSGKLTALADAPTGYSGVAGEAELRRGDGGSTMRLSVSGLEPETAYVAHLHTGGCDQPDPGGPHFQFEPGGPEERPNEIHLDLTSDVAGEAKAQTGSRRQVPAGEAGSIVLHVDEPHHGMTAADSTDPESALVLFVHEGVDHSKEGGDHGEDRQPQPAHSDKIACAELEGASASAGDGDSVEAGSAAAGDVPTIVVRDGEPVDGVAELEFSAGDEVRFRVSSDQAEEIHVHGYDVSEDVPAGGTVEIAFPAELEGIYEAELERLGVQIAELQINP